MKVSSDDLWPSEAYGTPMSSQPSCWLHRPVHPLFISEFGTHCYPFYACLLGISKPNEILYGSIFVQLVSSCGFPSGSEGKEPACNAEDPGSIPGSGRSPGEGNGNPLQYSCLENPMDRGAWQAVVHGVAKSQTWLSDFTHSLKVPSSYVRIHLFFAFT